MKRIHILLLAAIVVVKSVIAVSGGGQFFNPDETRYLRALQFAHQLAHGRIGSAIDILLEHPAHNFYAVTALPATLLHGLLGIDRWFIIPSLFNALLSSASALLVYVIIYRATSSPVSSAVAMVLAGFSPSLAYYTRFCLPYDAALFLILAAYYTVTAAAVSHGSPNGRPGRECVSHFTVGLLTTLSVLTYNGYWYAALPIASLTVYSIAHQGWQLRHIASSTCGFMLLPLALLLAAQIRGIDVISHYLEFSGTISHGDYGDGIVVTAAYLFYSEGLPAAILVLFSLLGLLRAWRAKDMPQLVLLCIPWLLIIATLLAFDVLGSFVIYGRTVRVIIPFYCVSSAIYLSRLSPRWAYAIAATVCVLYCYRLVPVMLQSFPAPSLGAAIQRFGSDLSVEYSVDGPPHHIEESRLEPKRFVFINYRYLYPIEGLRAIPSGTIVSSQQHPLANRAAWYDGYNREQRAILEKADLRMLVIDTANHASHLTGDPQRAAGR